MAEPPTKNESPDTRAESGKRFEPSPLSQLTALVRSQMLLDRRCRYLTRDDALNRIRSDYLELPGLRLTAPQAARLWGLALDLASDLLEDLVARRFLVRLDEHYCLR
jgi:hypothetical protein